MSEEQPTLKTKFLWKTNIVIITTTLVVVDVPGTPQAFTEPNSRNRRIKALCVTR
jgi:hypothetical protein